MMSLGGLWRQAFTGALSVAALAGCAQQPAVPPATHTTYAELDAAGAALTNFEQIPYGSGALQFGELRMPEGAGKVPLAVLIHGGCWRSQYGLRYMRPAAETLTASGSATWNIEFRRVGDSGGGWPGTFRDVADAVDAVRQLAAANPRIDTTRITLIGHSAGGQLALWAASRDLVPSPPEIAGTAPLRVQQVTTLAGITDIVTYSRERGGCNAAVVPLMGGTPEEVPERYRAVNPVQRLPLSVPVLLVQGASDDIVPPAQATEYERLARAAGALARVRMVAGATHFDVVAAAGLR